MSQSRPVVLVVEDDALQRMNAVDLVEDLGFEAVEAHNADYAISVLESRSDIRVVFTDVDMPGSMDGMRLAAVIRHRWPPIEIIITSGRRPRPEHMPARGVFFPKPYSWDEVGELIRRMAA